MPLLLAKSSSGESYEVSFETVDDRLIVQCRCAAGEQQQLCKHLVAFLTGDCSMLYQPDQEPLLLATLELAGAAGIVSDYADLQLQINVLDLELKQEKKRIEKARHELKGTFMRKLRNGYPRI
jgi:hypothetical protein